MYISLFIKVKYIHFLYFTCMEINEIRRHKSINPNVRVVMIIRQVNVTRVTVPSEL
jgi:hypothetical protein